MMIHEFFARYANTPLNKRFQIINFGKFGTMTLNQAYQRMTELEEKKRPYEIEEDSILCEMDELFSRMDKEKANGSKND